MDSSNIHHRAYALLEEWPTGESNRKDREKVVNKILALPKHEAVLITAWFIYYMGAGLETEFLIGALERAKG